jgi:hypothetical protein
VSFVTGPLYAQLAQLEALIREQPDRTLADLQSCAADIRESPHAVPHDPETRLSITNNDTRVGTRSR